MSGRSTQILETVLSIVDRATAGIRGVAEEADRLESADPTITVDADDKASADIREIEGLADRFDARTAEAKLKVEARAAKTDLRALERQLQDVDSTEAEAVVLADISAAERRLSAVDAELDKIARRRVEAQVDVDTDGVEGAGDKAGGLFSGGFSKALKGGAIIGTIFAVVAEGFNMGMERLQLDTRFRQQFGLVKADADRLGKEAAALYESGWGDSLGEVQSALGLVQQRLVQTKQVAASEADDIAEAALAMADVFGVDVADVIHTVGQLLLNGLAPDADAAMDQVIGAMQNGGNAAGDLFDSVDEYSQHFAGFGLSAEDMMAMFVTGMQNGQRDTDKLGDSVKEMRIRAVEDTDAMSQAYVDLGLDADTYRTKIMKGGEDGRTAFLDIIEAIRSVEDPVERNRLAIEFLGTQYEDLGPKGLDALAAIEQGTRDVSTATEDLVDDVDNTTSQVDILWRKASGKVGEAAEVMAGALNDALNPDTDDFIDKMQNVGFASDEARDSMLLHGSATDRLRGSVGNATPFLDAMAQRTAIVDAALVDATTSTRNLETATDDKAAADGEAEGAADDHRDAVDELRGAYALLRTELSDREAYLDLQDAFDDLETKGQEAWDAAASGSVEAEAKARDYERAQIAIKELVIDYAERTGNLPREVLTKVLAEIDAGSVASVENALNFTARDRVAVITGDYRETGVPQSTRSGRGAPVSSADAVPSAVASSPVTVSFAGANFMGTDLPEVTVRRIGWAIYNEQAMRR